MAFQALRGAADILPHDIERWLTVEAAARRVAAVYGYGELRTPLMEDTQLFLRSIGDTTDIIQKEMFRVTDRGDQDMVLRPEGTAAVIRAYLEHNLHKTQGFAKLFYLGPMFRAERPQAGRLRQFHQYGVEAIGASSPWVDVEVITLCVEILRACGVAQSAVWVSSLGCRVDQQRSAQHLRERLEPHRTALCKDCQQRFDRNVFRTLDCKQEACRTRAWAQGAPFLLCDECQQHFDEVRAGLRAQHVAFTDTEVFARGLDYYTRTVFEVRASGLGAQDAVAAGGRYDHLVEDLGGPAIGAVGFATGIERVLLAQSRPTDVAGDQAPRRGVYLAIAQPSLLAQAFPIVQRLRERGVMTALDYTGKSLKGQLREADKLACRWVAILGERELAQGGVSLKDLTGGEQRTVPLDRLADAVSK